MNWTEPRKGLKSSDNHRVQTTCLNTPPPKTTSNHDDSLFSIPQSNKQCPYHFSSPSHICLTCRRSICLRCAITYCQQHTIHPEEQILPLLLVDLQKLTVQPRIEDIELKLKQSQQKQKYMSKKILDMVAQIEDHFEHVKIMVDRKKQQVIQYYHEELTNKFLSQFKNQDNELESVLTWLRKIQQSSGKCTNIEELDALAKIVKKNSQKYVTSDSSSFNRTEKGGTLVLGKDKIKFHKIWSQEKLEKVLFQIQNISFKLSADKFGSNKKKRVTTEISEHAKVSPFSGAKGAMVKSGSNSRFNTGRKGE